MAGEKKGLPQLMLPPLPPLPTPDNVKALMDTHLEVAKSLLRAPVDVANRVLDSINESLKTTGDIFHVEMQKVIPFPGVEKSKTAGTAETATGGTVSVKPAAEVKKTEKVVYGGM